MVKSDCLFYYHCITRPGRETTPRENPNPGGGGFVECSGILPIATTRRWHPNGHFDRSSPPLDRIGGWVDAVQDLLVTAAG